MLDYIHLETLRPTASALERVSDVPLVLPTETSPIHGLDVFRHSVGRTADGRSSTVLGDRHALNAMRSEHNG
jgi:hypothetical protein